MFSVLRRYSVVDLFMLAVYKLLTPLYFPKARLVRLPIQVRGKKFMRVGKKFTTGKYCRLEVVLDAKIITDKVILQIGDNVQINDNVHIAAANSVVIGNNTLIASKVFITDHSHGNYSDPAITHDPPSSIPINRRLVKSAVTIGHNVWIGEFVSILPGVTIGEGSVIGTMSVVNKDIPAYCIAVGSPARVIKKYNLETERWEKV
jgi:acetyltransferase-like isoleucine patch superfamily enzyme